jgi:hypothetical protein
MKISLFGCLIFCLAGTCHGQETKPLCPKHIETPSYAMIARTAHIQGKVILSLVIGADGEVVDAEAINDETWVSLLKIGAISNIRLWTFTKPPSTPYRQTIIYDYQIDSFLPLNSPDKVSFDLPDKVTVVASNRSVNVTRSKTQ